MRVYSTDGHVKEGTRVSAKTASSITLTKDIVSDGSPSDMAQNLRFQDDLLGNITVTTPDNAEETSNNVYSLGLVDKMEVKELACKVSWFSGDQTHRFEVLGGTDPEFDVGQLLILDAELNDFYESDLDPFARSVLKVINDGQNSMDADGNTNYFFDAMPLRRDVVNVYLGNAAAQEFDKINGDQMLEDTDNKTFSFRTLIMSALKPLQGTEVRTATGNGTTTLSLSTSLGNAWKGKRVRIAGLSAGAYPVYGTVTSNATVNEITLDTAQSTSGTVTIMHAYQAAASTHSHIDVYRTDSALGTEEKNDSLSYRIVYNARQDGGQSDSHREQEIFLARNILGRGLEDFTLDVVAQVGSAEPDGYVTIQSNQVARGMMVVSGTITKNGTTTTTTTTILDKQPEDDVFALDIDTSEFNDDEETTLSLTLRPNDIFLLPLTTATDTEGNTEEQMTFLTRTEQGPMGVAATADIDTEVFVHDNDVDAFITIGEIDNYFHSNESDRDNTIFVSNIAAKNLVTDVTKQTQTDNTVTTDDASSGLNLSLPDNLGLDTGNKAIVFELADGLSAFPRGTCSSNTGVLSQPLLETIPVNTALGFIQVDANDNHVTKINNEFEFKLVKRTANDPKAILQVRCLGDAWVNTEFTLTVRGNGTDTHSTISFTVKALATNLSIDFLDKNGLRWDGTTAGQPALGSTFLEDMTLTNKMEMDFRVFGENRQGMDTKDAFSDLTLEVSTNNGTESTQEVTMDDYKTIAADDADYIKGTGAFRTLSELTGLSTTTLVEIDDDGNFTQQDGDNTQVKVSYNLRDLLSTGMQIEIYDDTDAFHAEGTTITAIELGENNDALLTLSANLSEEITESKSVRFIGTVAVMTLTIGEYSLKTTGNENGKIRCSDEEIQFMEGCSPKSTTATYAGEIFTVDTTATDGTLTLLEGFESVEIPSTIFNNWSIAIGGSETAESELAGTLIIDFADDITETAADTGTKIRTCVRSHRSRKTCTEKRSNSRETLWTASSLPTITLATR